MCFLLLWRLFYTKLYFKFILMCNSHGHDTGVNRHQDIYAGAAHLLTQKNAKEINILQYGCSSGETTLAMAWKIYQQIIKKKLNTKLQILALDICPEIINQAKKGEYKIYCNESIKTQDFIQSIKNSPWFEIDNIASTVQAKWDIINKDINIQYLQANADNWIVKSDKQFDCFEHLVCHNKQDKYTDIQKIKHKLKPNAYILSKTMGLKNNNELELLNILETEKDVQAIKFITNIFSQLDLTEKNSIFNDFFTNTRLSILEYSIIYQVFVNK